MQAHRYYVAAHVWSRWLVLSLEPIIKMAWEIFRLYLLLVV
jgi:hypothetical protein